MPLVTDTGLYNGVPNINGGWRVNSKQCHEPEISKWQQSFIIKAISIVTAAQYGEGRRIGLKEKEDRERCNKSGEEKERTENSIHLVTFQGSSSQVNSA